MTGVPYPIVGLNHTNWSFKYLIAIYLLGIPEFHDPLPESDPASQKSAHNLNHVRHAGRSISVSNFMEVFIMSELQDVINQRIQTVQRDLKEQAGYDLTNTQLDELRLTGRTCIDIVEFAPYFKRLIRYYANPINHHQSWLLLLNTISGDFEITLTGCLMPID